MTTDISVEVVYGLAHKQSLINLKVPKGCNVKDAIIKSNILNEYPQIDLEKHKVGIFSRIVSLDKVLVDKDRVEIYRPLIADPKKLRLQKIIKIKK